MKDINNFLKNINIPHFDNKNHYNSLEEKLILKIQKIESEKKQRLKPAFNPILKYSFASSFILILIVFVFWLINNLFNPEQLKLTRLTSNGNIYLKSNEKNNYKKIEKEITFNKNNLIKTDINSNISFKLGSDYNISILESSELKLLHSEKKNETEICKLYMINGKVEYYVELPTGNSIFQVNTDFSSFYVKGTKFTIDVKRNESIQLIVKEGKVIVGNYFKKLKSFNKIKKIDRDIYNELYDLINHELIIEQNNSIMINKNDIDLLNKEIYENVYIKIINNKTINEDEKTNIIENINKIKIEKENLLFSKRTAEGKDNKENLIIEQKKDQFNIIKLTFNINDVLQEKNTAISGDNNNLFIASDYNKAVYSIDVDKNKINWIFKNDDLMTITSPVTAYNDNIIFGCPYFLFILNNNGSIKIKKEIKNGPDYWINPIKANKLLYIPTSQTIYKFNGTDLSQLDNFYDSNGPLYISYDLNKIYINYLNSKKIKAYDLVNNNIIWESEELYQRAFMSPKITNKYLFIIDNSGMIYRFDLNSLKSMPKKMNIKTGVMSNIISINNNLYFVANDGYFYKIRSNLLSNFKRIIKVDNNNNIDKYLTKKLVTANNELYYCGENGYLFYFNLENGKNQSIKICENSLIGNPILIGNSIYIVDNKTNIYKITKE